MYADTDMTGCRSLCVRVCVLVESGALHSLYYTVRCELQRGFMCMHVCTCARVFLLCVCLQLSLADGGK